VLGLLAAGAPEPAWGIKPLPLGFFHLKGVIQFLCERLGLRGISERAEPGPDYLSKPAMTFRMTDKVLACVGAVEPEVLSGFDLPEEISVAYAELDLDLIAATPSPEVRIQVLPKIAPVTRDIALVVAEDVSQAQIQRVLEEAGRPVLECVRLFDLYVGKQIPAGKKSLAFRLSFSAGDKTLTEQEVIEVRQRILKRLEQEFQATLR